MRWKTRKNKETKNNDGKKSVPDNEKSPTTVSFVESATIIIKKKKKKTVKYTTFARSSLRSPCRSPVAVFFVGPRLSFFSLFGWGFSARPFFARPLFPFFFFSLAFFVCCVPVGDLSSTWPFGPSRFRVFFFFFL